MSLTATPEQVAQAVHELLGELKIVSAPLSPDDRLIALLERVDGEPFFPSAFRIPRKTIFLTGIKRRFAVALPRRAWEKSWKLGEFCDYLADRTTKDHLNVRVAKDQQSRMNFTFGFFAVIALIAVAALLAGMPLTVWIFILPILLAFGLVSLLGLRHHLLYRRIHRLRSKSR